MAKREDGRETRLRLLNAACIMFAKKGFRDARIADICGQAGANVASVNYYFGDKANLYREVWRHALENLEPPISAEASSASPEARLREFVHNLVRGFAAEGKLGQFGRLYLREMVNPTGLIQESWHELIKPRREMFHALLRELLPPGADDLQVRLCEHSIINQCRALVTISGSDLKYMLGHPLDAALLRRLADHIVDFSIAGIEAVGRRCG